MGSCPGPPRISSTRTTPVWPDRPKLSPPGISSEEGRLMPSFADLADAFLREELEESPVRGTALGLTEYDDRLDDLSETAITRRIDRDDHWLNEFRARGDGELSA